MPFENDVGGYPEGPGSEEARRPAHRIDSQTKPRAPGNAFVSDPRAGRLARLLGGRRFRLQAAGLAAILLIFVVVLSFPAQNLSITADGDTVSFSSRTSDDAAAVQEAGVTLEPGDQVVSEGDGELVVDRATQAVLKVDGETFNMSTQAETIEEALLDADIPLAPEDSVLRNDVPVALDAPLAQPESQVAAAGGEVVLKPEDEPIVLDVRRPVPFTVVENGHELELRSSELTVAGALRDVGVRLGPGDNVQPAPDTELTVGLQVHVEHAQQLVVTLPEGKKILYALEDSVEGALKGSGIELPSNYRLEPPAGTAIGPGLAVHVIGVSGDQVIETERIQSYTVYEIDPALTWGETRTVAGQDGVLYREYQLSYEDDVLVSRNLAAEWYDPQPADTVIYYSAAAEPPPPAPPALVTAGGQSWQDIVCSYGWDCAWALAVINCESGGNPEAYNPAGPYIGLFQIWGGNGGNLADPAVNIAAAYSLYSSGGSGHWPNCP